ncbi:24157_t:CDS:2, partial [Cetraspora pellucida]
MMIDGQSTAIVAGLPPGNVNFCGIELDEGYEPEVEEEEAFVTPVAHHEPYPTRRPVGRRFKRLKDKIEEQYRSILPRPEAPVEPPVNVDPLVAQPAIVNPPPPVPEAQIIESKDEILLLGMDWFKRTRARLHVDESKLYVHYQDQVAEVPMSYDGECPPVEATENEENGTFDEFEYEDEMLNEAEGYFTSEVSDNELFDNPWKDHHSPAVYLSHMEEIPTNEPDLNDESLEVRLKKSVCTTHLTPEQVQKAQTFLNDKKNVFAHDTNDLGQTTLTVHEIDTGSTTPIKQHPYHAAPSVRSFIKEEIEKLKEKGLGIRPDEDKVEKVRNFPVPQSLRELR